MLHIPEPSLGFKYLLPIFHKTLCFKVNKSNLDLYCQIFYRQWEVFVATLLDLVWCQRRHWRMSEEALHDTYESVGVIHTFKLYRYDLIVRSTQFDSHSPQPLWQLCNAIASCFISSPGTKFKGALLAICLLSIPCPFTFCL